VKMGVKRAPSWVGRILSIQVQASLVVDRLRAARASAFQVSTGSM
jgi:hypothetical protein